MIVTSFSKASPTFVVRKYIPKPEDKSIEVPRAKEVKIAEKEIEDSDVDKVIQGERSGVEVHFEDDNVIAYSQKKPAAKVHIIVAAKSMKP